MLRILEPMVFAMQKMYWTDSISELSDFALKLSKGILLSSGIRKPVGSSLYGPQQTIRDFEHLPIQPAIYSAFEGPRESFTCTQLASLSEPWGTM